MTVRGDMHVAVKADPLELELLFMNLMKNALEAAAEGRVRVTIENSGSALTETSGGHIEFTRRPEGGLIVRVTLNEADAWSDSHD